MSLCVSGSEGSFLFQSADSKVERKEVIRMNSIKDVEKLALFRIQESVIPADKEIDTVDIEIVKCRVYQYIVNHIPVGQCHGKNM